MVQLKLLSENQAGTAAVARRFPFIVGRSEQSHFRVDAPGVWDRHFELQLDREGTISLRALPNALVILNGEKVAQCPLHNGDTIEIGSAKMRFWLSETRQRALWPREALTWLGLALLSLGQIAVIYFLLLD